MHTSCNSVKLSGELDASSTQNDISMPEDDLALSSTTLEPTDKSLQDQTDHVPRKYNLPNKLVYLNEDTMDCNYSESLSGYEKSQINVLSPEMFESDEDERVDKANDVEELSRRQGASVNAAGRLETAEEKLSIEELVAKSDRYLLTRMNKFLTGVPPPPKHTICQSDSTELLAYIYDNRQYFLVDPLKRCDENAASVVTPSKRAETIVKNSTNERSFDRRAKSSLRNLTNAFDACDRRNESTTSTREELPRNSNNDDKLQTSVGLQSSCCIIDKVSEDTRYEGNFLEHGETSLSNSQTMSVVSFSEINVNKDNGKHVTFRMPHEERSSFYSTITVDRAKNLEYCNAYKHKTHGIHYNRSKYVEEFEGLTMKLCQRYVGAETQSSCNIWFTKQTPTSVKKRNIVARRANGQSPGKILSHLTKRRRTFSSANLQGLGVVDKKQLVLNIKKPTIRRGKSPRGKSPRGSAKKRGVRPSPSPRKSKLETSKRALFQSPPGNRAGTSRATLFINSNTQKIKRALFSTSKTKEETPKVSASNDLKKSVPYEESRKRKNEDELEGPRLKWAKSLSFDCAHSLESKSADSWSSERHSTGNFIMKNDKTLQQGKCQLSEAHRKKLLWAVAEALRSKGIGLGHPRFKQCASQLARTVKKYMPDLENRNVPRKSGSTSDRMLKLAKHHALLIVETKSTD